MSSPLAARMAFSQRAPSVGSASSRACPEPGHRKRRAGPAGRIVGKAARLVIDHVGQSGNFPGARPYLVDLLLVLHHGEAHAGMVEHIGHLFGDRVGIDRHRNRAERLRCRKCPVETRAVGADDGDAVAMCRGPAPEGQARILRTSSSCSRQVQLCQMPKSLWRMAGRSPSLSALRSRYFGNVSMSPANAVATMCMLLPSRLFAVVPAIMPAASRRATPSLE